MPSFVYCGPLYDILSSQALDGIEGCSREFLLFILIDQCAKRFKLIGFRAARFGIPERFEQFQRGVMICFGSNRFKGDVHFVALVDDSQNLVMEFV